MGRAAPLTPPVGAVVPRRPAGGLRGDRLWRNLTLAPALLLFGLLTLVPMASLLALSFNSVAWSAGKSVWTFVGLANFAALAADTLFRASIWNTAVFAGLGVVIQIVIGFVLALLVSSVVHGRTAYRAVFLLPILIPGIVIGAIASPDHAGGYGKACVYAPDLSREAILDALRARRCYASTAAKIFLDVRVNGHFMGEKLETPAGAKVTIEVKADCPADIDRVEICRNNEFIHCKAGGGKVSQFVFADEHPLAGRSYYYVRVTQKDGEIAWSSPVWFGVP